MEANAREKTAQQAASAARQELLLQRATEDFRAIVEGVERLTASITAKEWGDATKLLLPLKRQLPEANGSFQKLLKGIDMDKLDVAKGAVKVLTWATVITNGQGEETVQTVDFTTGQSFGEAQLKEEEKNSLHSLIVELPIPKAYGILADHSSPDPW